MIEDLSGLYHFVVGAVSQMLVQSVVVVPADLVARIENPLGVEDGLHLSKERHGVFVEKLQKTRPQPAVAVLARRAAAHARGQLVDVTGDQLHLLSMIRVLEIQHRSHVKVAVAAVAEDAGSHPVSLKNLQLAVYELGKTGGPDCDVLDKGDRLLRPLHSVEDRHGGRPQPPNLPLLSGIIHDLYPEEGRVPF